jgi:UDP-N-acetylglucosamine acyltransferase
MTIHPTAIISADAQIEENVTVGPYSIIGPDVCIGKNTIVGPHVVIERLTEIGESCKIDQFASIGGDPQDLKYKGEKTKVIIGHHNTIREFVTINRATVSDIGVTRIGNYNLLMAYSHVAHNCSLGDHVILANSANLAGHIHVDDYAIIGGLTGVHQFTRIGAHCIIGGASAVNKDVPPFTMASGNYAKLHGLNQIGLRRRGFTEETVKYLKKAYRIMFRMALLKKDAIEKIRNEFPHSPEIRQFITFIEESERGVCRH